jgi:hypothetical protein
MQNAANIPIILSFEICSDSAGQPGRVCPCTSQAVATPGGDARTTAQVKENPLLQWIQNILTDSSASIS